MSGTALFDDKFAEEIDVQRRQDNIKGLAVSVLKQDGSVETFTRGISSEHGAVVTSNVIGTCSLSFRRPADYSNFTLDDIQPWILL